MLNGMVDCTCLVDAANAVWLHRFSNNVFMCSISRPPMTFPATYTVNLLPNSIRSRSVSQDWPLWPWHYRGLLRVITRRAAQSQATFSLDLGCSSAEGCNPYPQSNNIKNNTHFRSEHNSVMMWSYGWIIYRSFLCCVLLLSVLAVTQPSCCRCQKYAAGMYVASYDLLSWLIPL